MNAPISERIRQEVVRLAWEGHTAREIAREIGISRTSVSHYAEGLLRPKSSRVTEQEIHRMRQLRVEGHSQDEIARMMRRSQTTVGRYTESVTPAPRDWRRNQLARAHEAVCVARQMLRDGRIEAAERKLGSVLQLLNSSPRRGRPRREDER